MGYSEVRCWLCRVSFNINRHRTITEPSDHALTSSDFYWEYGHYEDGGHGCDSAGCHVARRTATKKLLSRMKGPEIKEYEADRWSKTAELEDHLDPIDEDFVPEEYAEDDPLEFDSDGGDLDSDVDMDEAEEAEENSHDDDDDQGEVSQTYLQWARGESSHDSLLIKPVLVSKAKESFQERVLQFEGHNLEHISGPLCQDTHGYNGHHISYHESQYSSTFQCLLPKSKQRDYLGRYNSDTTWEAQSNDEDFESSTEFYLSGLGDDMPSRDCDYAQCHPRHDTSQQRSRHYRIGDRRRHRETVYAEDIPSYAVGGDWEPAIPFHPTCFELFKSCSRRRLGKVAVEEMVRVYHRGSFSADHGDFQGCDDQWWQHVPGTEWLIANPIDVPALKAVFQAAIRHHAIHPDANVFTDRRGNVSDDLRHNPTDPFLHLPTEITHLIIAHLSNRDIANLRHVSRQFEQLPQRYFYNKFLTDMPWLTELWDHTPRSKWCVLTRQELEEQDEENAMYEEEVENYWWVIKQDDPEMLDDWAEAEKKVREDRDQKWKRMLQERFDDISVFLTRDRTDWFMVYRGIVKGWKEMKGLRNRERIWKSLELLMGEMEKA